MAASRTAVKPSGVYGSSAGWARVSASVTCAAASSFATVAAFAPGTSTVTGNVNARPSCCAAATVSQLERFSFPSRCSATTRIIFSYPQLITKSPRKHEDHEGHEGHEDYFGWDRGFVRLRGFVKSRLIRWPLLK